MLFHLLEWQECKPSWKQVLYLPLAVHRTRNALSATNKGSAHYVAGKTVS
jgi:hypothetical protein